MTETAQGQQRLQSPSEAYKSASSAQRQAILVLGMHRSGTSALTGVISALGAAGPKTPMVPTIDNPRGYFESSALSNAHDALLTSAGSRWHDWRQIDARWLCSTAAEEYRQKIKDLLLSEYNDHPLIVIKDPRICRFVPFMSAILAELNIRPVAILPIRNPLEIAYSLKRRDSFPVPKSILLWLRHVLEAEIHSRQMQRCFVPYEEFLRDWQYYLDGIGKKIGVVWPNHSDSLNAKIGEFLTLDLHHENVSHDEMKNHPDVFPLAIETYNALTKIAADGESQEILDRLDLIRGKFDEGCQIFGAVVSDEETITVNGLIAERTTLVAARNMLASERHALERKHKSLTAERDVLTAKCNSLIEERATLVAVHNRLVSEHRALARDHENLTAERDMLTATCNSLIGERDAVATARNNLVSERDALVGDHIRLREERDTIAAAYNSLGTERDAMLTSRSWRLTAPLRSFKRLFSQLFRSFGRAVQA
jgi:hypothetical protein